ncbi:MAG: DNA polymerase III subunit beta [Clostridia bacterium]
MKIECYKQNLNIALNAVAKTASSKSTMPILDGVLIEAKDGYIKLTTNDLDMGSEYKLVCDVISEGKVVVDLKMFMEIVRKLEGDILAIELINDIFIIKSKGSIYKLATMNADDYPLLPVFNVDNKIKLPQNIFKDMIRKTNFAVSMDENRPVYTGQLVKIENNVLTVVAIDGFRLALKKYLLEKDIVDFKAIVPGKVLTEIVKLLSDDDTDVEIGINKNQALFEIGNCTVVSRLIDGEFLNYSGIIPSDKETRIKTRTKDLLNAFERVALFSKESADKDKKSPVKMDISLDGIILSCNSQTGDAKENLSCVTEGKPLVIGFNPRYMIDALKFVEDEEIYLDFTTGISPATIKPVTGNDFIYMVLPLKIKQEG